MNAKLKVTIILFTRLSGMGCVAIFRDCFRVEHADAYELVYSICANKLFSSKILLTLACNVGSIKTCFGPNISILYACVLCRRSAPIPRLGFVVAIYTYCRLDRGSGRCGGICKSQESRVHKILAGIFLKHKLI